LKIGHFLDALHIHKPQFFEEKKCEEETFEVTQVEKFQACRKMKIKIALQLKSYSQQVAFLQRGNYKQYLTKHIINQKKTKKQVA